MKKTREINLLFLPVILTVMPCSQALIARGAIILKDGKILPPLTEEEYRKLPGENLPIKIGEDWLVPNVVGKNYDYNPKFISLDLVDFWVGKVKRVPSDRPKGEILSQIPKGKSLVPKPTSVNLIISSGPLK